MKRLLVLVACVGCLTMLAACSKSEDTTTVKTRTIQDVTGEVNIPAEPKRIVDLSGNSDSLSILGYKVIGTANSDAYDYKKFPSYLEDTLKGATILGYSMQDTMDIEGVINANPDLIIISTVQEKMYEQLKKVAPVVMLKNEDLNWKDNLTHIAEVFGREKEADTWLSSYETKAKKAGDLIKSRYGEKTTYLSFLASGGQFFVFSNAGFGDVLYNDMGLGIPSGMPAQSDISLPVVTYEGLVSIQADYIFTIATDEAIKELEANAVYNGLSAVKSGQVITLDSSPYFNQGYSPIGRELLVDEIAGMLDGTKK